MHLRSLAERAIPLRDNRTCPYCLEELVPGSFDEEHVIGRRFVRKGSFDGQWNLILNACMRCNRQKAALEDDISAITMYRVAGDRARAGDQGFADDAHRKARGSRSRRTGKPVLHSGESQTVETTLGPGVRVTFRLSSPPQVDKDRIFELAGFQVAGFLYRVTYSAETGTGDGIPGGFAPMLYAYRSDWGNVVLRAFADTVVAWEPLILASTAGDLFKIAIRRQPGASCWSWAVEWNGSTRVVGFLGELPDIERVVSAFPRLYAEWIPQPDGSRVAVRADVALAGDDDRMFYWRAVDGQEYRV
jgi:hypothetical protein